MAKVLLGADEQFCSACGEVMKKEAEVCPKCAVKNKLKEEPKARKSKLVAAALAFFLGGLGIHKFYLNRTGQGLIYLCFSWTLIPMFVAFIETVYYLILSDEAFDKKYN